MLQILGILEILGMLWALGTLGTTENTGKPEDTGDPGNCGITVDTGDPEDTVPLFSPYACRARGRVPPLSQPFLAVSRAHGTLPSVSQWLHHRVPVEGHRSSIRRRA